MTIFELDRNGKRRTEERPGFFRRQLSPPTTRAQTFFDVFLGIVAPILCFVFDPIVFKGGFDNALLPQFQSFAYMVSAVEILILIVWLVWGRNFQPAARFAGGMLMAGALISLVTGVIILPFTLLGLMFGIGVFGFIPFLTFAVYLRRAKSAFQLAAKPAPGPRGLAQHREVASSGAGALIGATIVGCVLVLGPPAGLNFVASMFMSQAMNAVVNADERKADLAIDEITYLQFFTQPQFDKLVLAYEQANDQSRKEQLRQRYFKLTGIVIEQRLRILAD
jgi:hypothetical protein